MGGSRARVASGSGGGMPSVSNGSGDGSSAMHRRASALQQPQQPLGSQQRHAAAAAAAAASTGARNSAGLESVSDNMPAAALPAERNVADERAAAFLKRFPHSPIAGRVCELTVR